MDIVGALNLVIELIWTLIRVNYETLRGIWKTILPNEPKDVKDDVVLITGAGHGMGREMALRFARLGAVVVCVDINAASNEETAKMIQQEKGSAYSYQCDVSNRVDVMKLKDKVCREVGDVAILVNNAGIMPCKPVLEQGETEIRLMNEVNINAQIWMIQAFLPNMMARNYGHIVAMSSMAGLMGLTNLVPYCGSKYAVRGIMEALAVELRDDPRGLRGIKFTTVYPYIVDTGLCKHPRIRFQQLMKVLDAGEAADMIVDGVRRELVELTLPPELHFMNRYIYRLLPFEAACIWNDFFNTGLEPQD